MTFGLLSQAAETDLPRVPLLRENSLLLGGRGAWQDADTSAVMLRWCRRPDLSDLTWAVPRRDALAGSDQFWQVLFDMPIAAEGPVLEQLTMLPAASLAGIRTA